MVIQEDQSAASAGATPNSSSVDAFTDAFLIEKLAKVSGLIIPGTNWVEGETDEGGRYYHIGDPRGLIDYLIEPVAEGLWRGVSNGSARLMHSALGETAGSVAFMAASALALFLSITAEAAASLIGG